VSKHFSQGEIFIREEKVEQAQAIKILRNKAKEYLGKSSKLTELVLAIKDDSQDEAYDGGFVELTVDEAEENSQLQQLLYNSDEINSVIKSIVCAIEVCALETKKMLNHIVLSLEVEDCFIQPNVAFTNGVDLSSLSAEQVRENALFVATDASNRASRALSDANELLIQSEKFQNYFSGATYKQRALALKQVAMAARSTCWVVFNCIKLTHIENLDEELQADVAQYLTRAKIVNLASLHKLILRKIEQTQTRAVKNFSSLPLLAQSELIDKKVCAVNATEKTRNATIAEEANSRLQDEFLKITNFSSLNAVQLIVRNITNNYWIIQNAATDDVEVIDYIEFRVRYAVSEIKQSKQLILEMKSKLKSIQDWCYTDETDKEDCTEQLHEMLANLESVFGATGDSSSQSSLSDYSTEDSKSDYEQKIKDILVAIVHACNIEDATFKIPKEEIHAKILNLLNFLKMNGCVNQKNSLQKTWGIWLVLEVLIYVNEFIYNYEDGIEKHLETAYKHLKGVERFIATENPDLKSIRTDVMKNIKQAYKDVYAAKIMRSRYNSEINHKVEQWDLIPSTLFWAARLTDSEYKWLETQSSLKETSPKLILSYMSPIRLAYIFMHTYSSDKLEETKETLGQLNRFKRRLEDCERQLYNLMQKLHLNKSNTKDKGLDKLIELHKKLVNLVEKNYQRGESEKIGIEILRSSILEQALRIHFKIWKSKTCDPSKHSARLKAIKSATLTRQKLGTIVAHSDNAVLSKQPSNLTDSSFEVASNAKVSGVKKNKFASSSQDDESLLYDAVKNTSIDDMSLMLRELESGLKAFYLTSGLPQLKTISPSRDSFGSLQVSEQSSQGSPLKGLTVTTQQLQSPTPRRRHKDTITLRMFSLSPESMNRGLLNLVDNDEAAFVTDQLEKVSSSI
jgi:hypothetical protein